MTATPETQALMGVSFKFRNGTPGRDVGTTAMSEDVHIMPPAYNAVECVLATRPVMEFGNRRRGSASQSYTQVFGESPTVTEMICLFIGSSVPSDAMPNHVLWGTILMKVYTS